MADYKMGEKILDDKPLISGRIEKYDNINMGQLTYKIILDGISHEVEYNDKESSISLKVNQPLKERFHVVTFEVTNNKVEPNRETRIFYNELFSEE